MADRNESIDDTEWDLQNVLESKRRAAGREVTPSLALAGASIALFGK